MPVIAQAAKKTDSFLWVSRATYNTLRNVQNRLTVNLQSNSKLPALIPPKFGSKVFILILTGTGTGSALTMGNWRESGLRQAWNCLILPLKQIHRGSRCNSNYFSVNASHGFTKKERSNGHLLFFIQSFFFFLPPCFVTLYNPVIILYKSPLRAGSSNK